MEKNRKAKRTQEKKAFQNEKRKKIVHFFYTYFHKIQTKRLDFFIVTLSFLQIYCESKEFLNQKQQMQKLEYCSKHHLQKMTF